MSEVLLLSLPVAQVYHIATFKNQLGQGPLEILKMDTVAYLRVGQFTHPLLLNTRVTKDGDSYYFPLPGNVEKIQVQLSQGFARFEKCLSLYTCFESTYRNTICLMDEVGQVVAIGKGKVQDYVKDPKGPVNVNVDTFELHHSSSSLHQPNPIINPVINTTNNPITNNAIIDPLTNNSINSTDNDPMETIKTLETLESVEINRDEDGETPRVPRVDSVMDMEKDLIYPRHSLVMERMTLDFPLFQEERPVLQKLKDFFSTTFYKMSDVIERSARYYGYEDQLARTQMFATNTWARLKQSNLHIHNPDRVTLMYIDRNGFTHPAIFNHSATQ